jgi:hypothetical protein
MVNLLTRCSLNDFFEELHYRIPQELRLMIYDELLTKYMMHKIATCASPTAYAYPLDHGIFTYKPTPRFLNPHILDKTFAAEIVKAFYCKYSGFEVKHPLRIATLLQRDFFKLGPHIKLANHALRSLTVGGCLLSDNKHYIDVKLLPAHFASLFSAQLAVAPDFHLAIRLWTDDSSRANAEDLSQGAALRRTLQALKKIFARLAEKEPKATHSVVLEVARRHKVALDMSLAEMSSQRLAKAIYDGCCELQNKCYPGVEDELTIRSLSTNKDILGKSRRGKVGTEGYHRAEHRETC